ncbi:helix-turn-helix domain-containing protein [Enterococcus sp. DIV0170]|uniref:helix-turn-helix domain-containing protein n=1 Tax=Enterococcus sp. DIV0170 TaxID=2774642 RepID=UPI003F23FF6D
MGRILILTKNLLAEQELQLTLQRSNEEVYCSFNLLNSVEKHQQFFSYFSVIIFSDTVSTQEFAKFHSLFKKTNQIIIRKGNLSILKNSEHSYLTDVVDHWIDLNGISIGANNKISLLTDTISETEKRMESKKEVNSSNTKIDLFFSKLSNNEKKLLYHLAKANGRAVSRFELSYILWGTELSSSQMSQLSSLKKRICKKLVETDFSEDDLTILWKKGYLLSNKLLRELMSIPYFKN